MSHELQSVLHRLGPAKAEDIARDLGVSQPTVSRMLNASALMIARVGGSKNTLYGYRRQIRQIGELPIPIYIVDEHGNAAPFGVMHGVMPEGYLVDTKKNPWPLEHATKRHFYSIPYFIQDMRPQGFMGRSFARAHAEALGVSDKPERWTDDQIMVVLAMHGEDLPGNLLVGDISYRRWVSHATSLRNGVGIINEEDIGQHYVEMAEKSMSDGAAGSSAGGEFPKFTAVRTLAGVSQHVIVKFSGRGSSPAEQRWSDLLRCESHAAGAVTEMGVDAASSRAFRHGGRTFMESVRFDRIDLIGRKPVCSLASLDAELTGMGDPDWDAFAGRLHEIRLLNAEDVSAIKRAWYFGKLIANSDMHAGNLAFAPGTQGQLSLCPIYDMLPMRYAPHRGGEVPEATVFDAYHPLPGNEGDFRSALAAATLFWDRVSNDLEIHEGFRDIASGHLARLVSTYGHQNAPSRPANRM